jgi:uncharacterized coiled-coil protein SlyX
VSDEPDNVIHILLRRMDAKLDRIIEDVKDLKGRMSALELEVAHLSVRVGEISVRVAETNARIDRIEVRLDRIERRLDLVEDAT